MPRRADQPRVRAPDRSPHPAFAHDALRTDLADLMRLPCYYHRPDRRRVTVSFRHSGQTCPPKPLKEMIEVEARWSEDDLRRLKLIR